MLEGEKRGSWRIGRLGSASWKRRMKLSEVRSASVSGIWGHQDIWTSSRLSLMVNMSPATWTALEKRWNQINDNF